MAFRFLSGDKGPPPPPKDEQFSRPYSRSESVNVSSSSSIMTTTTKNNSKLSLAALLTRIPNPLSASSREPPNDDGISLPWNFQHHVHVDEGYVGLPPSWLTTAFTEEEITQIQARRTTVLHGVGGGGFHHNHNQMRPPSPTSSLYPSVIQGHRRNKSSVDSTASSSTPNLALPSLSESTSSHYPMSLSSTNLASFPASPSLPFPRRSPSPAPTNASRHPQQPPSTPSSATFSLAPRNILSDLSSAVKSSAGKGMRMFRVKRNIGLGGSSSTSPPPSSMNRKNVHSRLSDETFFPPEIVSPDRATLSPTSPPLTGSVAPVWEMYSTSKSYGRPSTTNPHHQPQPSTSTSIHSKKSSLRRTNTSSSSTIQPNQSTSSLSRTPSLKNTKKPPSLSRSHSSKSLSSARSLSSSASPHSHHPLPSSSTPPRPAPVPSSQPPGPSSSLPSTSLSLPSSMTTTTTQPLPLTHRPPHLFTSHSHSGSLTSLVSIPEASPAPGAVVPVPVPAIPTVFGKSNLTRKTVTQGSKQRGGANGSSSSRHHHHANPSISSISSAQTHVSDAGSSHSHSRSDSQPHSKSPQPPTHKPTPSTSSQQSSSSTTSSSSTHSPAHSNASSQSISSSTSANSDLHKTQELPMLSLSLPRMSLSLPFGEGSFGAGLLGTAGGVGSTSTAATGGGTPWLGSTTATGSSSGQASSTLSSSMSKWGNGTGSGKSGIISTNYASGSSNIASGSGTMQTNGSDGPEPPPKPVSNLIFPSISVAASSSTSNLTSSLRLNPNLSSTSTSTSTPNLTSTSTPNLLSSSTPTPRVSMLPLNATSTPTPTMPIPIPRSSRTPATTPSSTPTGTGTSPARRRPLPSSKPLPSYPVPALPSSAPSSSSSAGMTKLMPSTPTPFSPFQPSGLSMGARHYIPSPLPAPPVASGSGSGPGVESLNPTATASNFSNPLPRRQQPANAASLLSPPPSAMMTASNMLSPPLSTAAKSAAQSPNSAQLWSEIAQMMDPGMMSAIPGLHLSTALPEDVRDVVRRAGEGGASGEDKRDRKEGHSGEEVPKLVGDLVGPSPPVSAAELGGGVAEGSIASRIDPGHEKDEEDGGDDSGSEEYEEESYDGVVQSASVVAALPHHTHHPLPQLQTQPLTIPIIPRVIEPLRTVGRPRLVNVNANGLVGAEQVRSKEKGGEVELELEFDRHNIPGPSTQENRDTMRSSTATIVPGVNGQGAHSRLHRPPSMKLVISNGLGHAIRNGMGEESSAMATTGTVASGQTEGGGGTNTSYLAYYLEGGEELSTPSPLPSPGSALGSPLRDVESGDEGGSGSGRFGFGFGSESTPNSSLSYGERRFDYESGYDEKYRLNYDEAGRRDEGGLVGARGGSEAGSEDDFYANYREEDTAGCVKKQSRALPLTTPTITLNDGARSLSDDDDDNTRSTKVPLNGIGSPISPSSSSTDLTSPFLSSSSSPFQQRYLGWVSTLVAPLSGFIDEAVDPRDHYLDLMEIAEGESGSVYAARVNKSNARKLKLGEVVRLQDLDDLGLRDSDDEQDGSKEAAKNDEGGAGAVNENGNEEPVKSVAIKSIALVPSGTPKLVDLERELNLMKGLWHPQVLSIDAVYVDLVEDSVWLRMELMERSLADVIVLVERGLVLQERTIARFASDVLLALEFISRHSIAHRDVRSDNMLINNQGILKLADFTNAVRVDPSRPLHTDVVGVPYWQAPELLHTTTTPDNNNNNNTTTNRRSVPPYDPLKLDVWSLGSTVWEMAETIPPFLNTNKFEDRWPPLSQPALYSPAFHEFLRKCSEPASLRPSATDLLQAPFINNACGRPVIVQLLAQCRTIEWGLLETN